MRMVLFVGMCFILTSSGFRESIQYHGTATDLRSGQFYYTEEHEEWHQASQPSETRITYKDDARTVIVTKKIDYFLQEDLRDGSMEEARTEGGVTELTYRRNRNKAVETRKIRIPPPVVIDGGFTNFVKLHWQDLERGEKISFSFAVPSQLDYFSFRMSKAQETTFNGKHAVIYKMELDHPILRAILPAVLLTYNKSSRRLMRYEGISNINDKTGKSYHVRIVYPTTGP
jgi:hypothetical protein